MKLDSIIYDVNTLATALQESLINESPTFNAMYPSETATSLVTTLAGYGSMLQYSLVSAMANCYVDSAYSPAGIYQLAETLGNKLHGNVAARVICDIERITCNGIALSIPKETVFEIDGMKFFNPSTITFSASGTVVQNVTLVQGEVVEVNMTSSGIAGEKLYFSESFEADPNNLAVYVNNTEWQVSDTFIAYDSGFVIDPSELQVVVVNTDSEGRSYVRLGNGSSGLLPPAGSAIKVRYVSNLGAKGNIAKNNLDIELKTSIYDSNDQLLKVRFPKSTTSYGGSNTQSLDVLKESSPYVFASGDRAVRRTDYNAMFLNKCGYLSCNVWGEYEEANYLGTFDKIMMNMVYYTGIKSFQIYDYYTVGLITNHKSFTGSLKTTRPFKGSTSIKLSDINDPRNYLMYSDNGGKGILFNNNDAQFDIDNLSGSVQSGTATVSLIHGGVSNNRGVNNIVYNDSALNLYYESNSTPTLTAPIQIAIDYVDRQVLAGLKFFIPTGDAAFLNNAVGSFALYGTNSSITKVITVIESGVPKEKEVINTEIYNNVKNNPTIWTRVINRTPLMTNNLGEWTNWYATNSFHPENEDENNWDQYKHYVLEIYSVQDNSNSKLRLGKIKLLYDSIQENEVIRQASTINYENNGSFDLYIPTLSDIKNFYNYNMTITNARLIFGYKVGDILTYRYLSGFYSHSVAEITNPGSGYAIDDIVRLTYQNEGTTVDTGLLYKITAVDSTTGAVLSGDFITGQSISNLDSVVCDTVVEFNKLVNITASTSPTNASMEVTANSSGTSGGVAYDFDNPTGLQLTISSVAESRLITVLLNSLTTTDPDNDFAYSIYLEDLAPLAGDIEISINDQLLDSTDAEGTVSQKGAKISSVSSNAISVQASYVGNKIDEKEISSIDQPIINEYNHFTTFIEFKQPEVVQAHIDIRVKYKDISNIAITKQNIINNINKLFDITPSYLGKSLKLSDIYNEVHDTEGVDYCLVDLPTTNIDVLPYQFIVLSSLNIEDIV